MEKVLLVPVGEVDQSLVDWLEVHLADVIDSVVESAPEITLPERGYNERREQYLGDSILEALRRLSYPDAGRLLGLVNADLYARGLNFIFGQASVHGRTACVALPRLRQSFYGLPEDEELFHQRVLKECVHELGHTWGLEHCPNPKCVMYFSNTLADTDQKSVHYCPECSRKLPSVKPAS